MTTIFDAQRRPFCVGEPVIIIEPRGRRHYVSLRHGDKFHHIRTGHIGHDQIIGQPPGCLLRSDTEEEVVCLRPSLEDYLLKILKRQTTIIYPRDLAGLLVRGDLFPGARVMEAGIGSGATSIFLLRHLGSTGALISYERREEFLGLAEANIRKARELLGDSGATHKIVPADIYDGIQETDLDAILLDVPEPHRATATCLRAIRPGGALVCWLPTVTQVYLLVRDLQSEPRWSAIETTEVLQRNWEVNENAIRPFHRMVGHTGFMISARKLY